MRSYWIRNWTHVSCIGGQITYHWVTRDFLFFFFFPSFCFPLDKPSFLLLLLKGTRCTYLILATLRFIPVFTSSSIPAPPLRGQLSAPSCPAPSSVILLFLGGGEQGAGRCQASTAPSPAPPALWLPCRPRLPERRGTGGAGLPPADELLGETRAHRQGATHPHAPQREAVPGFSAHAPLPTADLVGFLQEHLDGPCAFPAQIQVMVSSCQCTWRWPPEGESTRQSLPVTPALSGEGSFWCSVKHEEMRTLLVVALIQRQAVQQRGGMERCPEPPELAGPEEAHPCPHPDFGLWPQTGENRSLLFQAPGTVCDHLAWYLAVWTDRGLFISPDDVGITPHLLPLLARWHGVPGCRLSHSVVSSSLQPHGL